MCTHGNVTAVAALDCCALMLAASGVSALHIHDDLVNDPVLCMQFLRKELGYSKLIFFYNSIPLRARPFPNVVAAAATLADTTLWRQASGKSVWCLPQSKRFCLQVQGAWAPS